MAKKAERKRRRARKHGGPGYEYIIKHYGDKKVRQRIPPPPPETWSPKQEDHRDHMKKAAQCGTAAMADPAATAFYRRAIRNNKKRKRWSVYQCAVCDYFNPPCIQDFSAQAKRGEPGALVRVQAVAKFDPHIVTFGVRARDGTMLETGVAQKDFLHWQFRLSRLPTAPGWEFVVNPPPAAPGAPRRPPSPRPSCR